MGCERALLRLVTGLALVAGGCASTSKDICSPVPSLGSPAVSCVAVAEPAPKPKPKPRPPAPAPEPEAKPEPEPKPVVVKQESIELDRTVQFLPDSAKLIDDSKSLLDEVAKVLEDHPEVQEVQIEGYTDSRLSARHNKSLSVRRANSVRSYLIKRGIRKDRLTAKGFGADKPIADNATYDGRLKNRRVELKITKRDDADSPKQEAKGTD